MSVLHTADAIVLRQYPYRETSVLVSCLTDRFGKIKGIVKGLRQQPNRHRSPMELLTLNRIVFYDHRNSTLHLISQCELLASFQELTRDLETMRLAASFAELVDVVVEADEPQPGLFELLKHALERLATHVGDPVTLRIHFVLRLLRLIGFQPQFDECTSCGRRPRGMAFQAYWSVRQGGLVCESCLHDDPHAEPIQGHILETLSACAETDEPRELDAASSAVIHQHLDDFLRWRIDRPLKTLGHAGGTVKRRRAADTLAFRT